MSNFNENPNFKKNTENETSQNHFDKESTNFENDLIDMMEALFGIRPTVVVGGTLDDTKKSKNCSCGTNVSGCIHNHNDHNCSCKATPDSILTKPSLAKSFKQIIGTTNLYVEDNGTYILKMLIPGARKQDVKVSYIGKTLSVNVTYDLETPTQIKKKEFSEKVSFTREFVLEKAMFESTSLNLTDGVLTIIIPAKEDATRQEIRFS